MIVYLLIGLLYAALVIVFNARELDKCVEEENDIFMSSLVLFTLTIALVVLWPVHLLKEIVC